MAHEHFIGCDVILPDGTPCDSREKLQSVYDNPVGWTVLTSYVKSDPSNMLPWMEPIIQGVKDMKPEGEGEKFDVDKAMAGVREVTAKSAPTMKVQPVVCPKHDLPKIKIPEDGFPPVLL